MLRLSSHICQLFPSYAPSPLFAFQQKPNKILMNPIWPLVAVSAASLTFLKRGTALLCLLTAAHGGRAAHDDAVLHPLVGSKPGMKPQCWCWLPAETDPLIPPYMDRWRSYTDLSWWLILTDSIQSNPPQPCWEHIKRKGIFYCHIKEAQGLPWVQKTQHAAWLIVSNSPYVCLPPAPSFLDVSSCSVQHI